MIEVILKIIFCHLFGDYVLQSDYIARTKGENWYHLMVHCVLYCLPFYVAFGFSWRILFTFIIHVLVDASKARYKIVDYFTDQVMHYTCALVFLY